METDSKTPIEDLGAFFNDHLFIKRDDLYPYCFGGNKARKAVLFFQQIDKGDYDTVVTYGSSHSNHCRVVANMAAARGIACHIISPQEVSEPTFNSQMMALFGAQITAVPVQQVHETIEDVLERLCAEGRKPYFIPGGGHGNTGTQAYVDCYQEIRQFENESSVHFDYVFHASGTGTTQAGLICGQLMAGDERRIVGISIARKNPCGRDVVLASVREYLAERYACPVQEKDIQEKTIFVDDYVGGGYGKDDRAIERTIRDVMLRYGIPLDGTYTGKAYWGMGEYLRGNGVSNKNILFIHTGGTPLYFDWLR